MPEHKVKRAYDLQAGSSSRSHARWYVAECICGWSSALHESASDANEAYRRHKAGEPAVVRPALTGSFEAFR